MNEYGAMVEWYWQGKTEVLGENNYTAWVVDEWWVWSNGEMILTGQNWSTGEKTLYSVGGGWMDGYGAMVEWYWQDKSAVLGEKDIIVSLCPPQNPHGLAWDRTHACTVIGLQWIASVMAWPDTMWSGDGIHIPHEHSIHSDLCYRDSTKHNNTVLF